MGSIDKRDDQMREAVDTDMGNDCWVCMICIYTRDRIKSDDGGLRTGLETED